MTLHPEYQYLQILDTILKEGDQRIDRTGVGTLSIFGAMMRFDLSQGQVPILTTKRTFWKAAVKEMLWFLTGGTNIRELLQEGVTIWSDWPLKAYRQATGDQISQEAFEQRIVDDAAFAAQWGDLGPVYGKQWRRWLGADGREYDQIGDLIETLRTNPASRRMLFHGWKVDEVAGMALPPCHLLYQCHASNRLGPNGKPMLSMLMYQRSVDSLLGLPFNLIGTFALQHMIAQQADMDLGSLVWMGGDTHLYLNHLEQAKLQLTREPRPFPTMRLARKAESIDDYKFEDFIVDGYDPHPAIKAEVAV